MSKSKKKIPDGWGYVKNVSDQKQPFQFNTRSSVQWQVTKKKGTKVLVTAIESGRTKEIPGKTLVYLEY